MRRDALEGLNQLLQRRMAEQHQPAFGPQGAQRVEHLVPALPRQRLPQSIRRLQQRDVLIEQGQRITHRSTRGADPAQPRQFFALQRIQPQLGARKMQPHQSIEEIVPVAARRHLARVIDELLIGHACRQFLLRHKADTSRTFACIEGGADIPRLLPPLHGLQAQGQQRAMPSRRPVGQALGKHHHARARRNGVRPSPDASPTPRRHAAA